MVNSASDGMKSSQSARLRGSARRRFEGRTAIAARRFAVLESPQAPHAIAFPGTRTLPPARENRGNLVPWNVNLEEIGAA